MEPPNDIPAKIPAEIQAAREAIARRAAQDRVHPTREELSAAWILISSTWRLKFGGSTTCAVCGRRSAKGRRDLCNEHAGYRFLWNHHSWHGEEQWRFTVRQLHDAAGLPIPDHYLETPTEHDWAR